MRNILIGLKRCACIKLRSVCQQTSRRHASTEGNSNVSKKKKKETPPVTPFVTCNDEDINDLLEGSKAQNTNRSTESAMKRLRSYLLFKELG